MEFFYLLIVILLAILAVSDLVVGVSNDAVNFLNSAFGSKVAKRRTVLIVASIGIALGAISSNGMMEIARKGIFNPEMFVFAEIMVIFISVMISDIILLDLFNTFGMPTSTTVSIMFELLGAAFVMTVIKLINTGDSFMNMGDYLNWSNAIMIISGIFLSVFIAFTAGLISQFIFRLLFSFDLKKSLKTAGPIFGGFALAIITYFLLFKGFKNSKLMDPDFKKWMVSNTILFIGILFAIWTVICFILVRFFRINVLKFVVLAGTFSLAMAFAGNDLVNFIGVPLAGFSSYEFYASSGVAANELNMSFLGEKAEANTWMLLGAGAIMVLTLWFSKKSAAVTETEINLASHNSGKERFRSSWFSRSIVKGGMQFGKFGESLLPKSALRGIRTRMDNESVEMDSTMAFDLVRASVNLMVASILIAIATSRGMPLSTTYVSFMVAMGTSLADKAWDRDSAVYRVSGVVNVISGWLLTALLAFTTAGIIAVLLYFFKIYALIALVLFVVFLVYKTNRTFKKKSMKKSELSELFGKENITSEELYLESEQRIGVALQEVGTLMNKVMEGLSTESRRKIEKVNVQVVDFQDRYEALYGSFYSVLKKIDSTGEEEGLMYSHIISQLQDIGQSVEFVSNKSFEHLQNFHKPLGKSKTDNLKELSVKLNAYFDIIAEIMTNKTVNDDLSKVQKEKKAMKKYISQLELDEIRQLKKEKHIKKDGILYFSILLEIRDLVKDSYSLMESFEKQVDLED